MLCLEQQQQFQTQTTMNTSMKNKVQLIGNLGNDPELKNLAGGQAMLRLRLATNEKYKGADGEWKETTQWHPVVAWGKQAEVLATLVRKGSVARAAGMIMVMSSAHATPTSAPSVITKPRLRREHCFTPPICR